MIGYLIFVFVFGYILITVEHAIKIDKTAIALYTGVIAWVVYVVGSGQVGEVEHELRLHLGGVSEILFFLMGAMTIIELIDLHKGFDVITNRITTQNKRTLLWMISLLTFFLSALLDNLTTSIVMVSLIRKLIKDKEQMKFYAGLVIIAANAGGAWSPIGDITTTMLWIGGQITVLSIMKSLFIPSLICLLVPLFIASLRFGGETERAKHDKKEAKEEEKIKGSKTMLIVGVGALVFVPVFKTVTHLPPYMGMLLGLSLVWVISEVIHFKKDDVEKKPFSAVHALSKIDASSVLFFLGILLAVGALEVSHVLVSMSEWMNRAIGDIDAVVIAMGVLSSIVDNVPLVAASMGMYSLADYPTDHQLWQFIAYCAGTGGSILIIGSASGVTVMGMLKINFFWYIKKISLLAMVGYFAGAMYYLIISSLF